MSYAESNVSTSGYNDIRIVVTLSGTSATASVQFRRNGSCGDYNWYDQNSTLTINGTTKGAAYSQPGYVCGGWVTLVTVSGFTLSSSGGTYSWAFNKGSKGKLSGSGTFTIGASVSVPVAEYAKISSRTYNTVTGKFKMLSWGGASTIEEYAFIVDDGSTTNLRANGGKANWQCRSGCTASTAEYTSTLTNDSISISTGPYTLCGCRPIRLGIWATNSAGKASSSTDGFIGESGYLPPAPLTSLTVSTSVSGTTATATVKITGAAADGTNNISGAKVTTQYRVYNGSSWGDWATAASNHSPATTQTVTVTGLPGSTSCQVQARQLTYADTSQISEVKTTSFTTPSTYHLTYNGSEATSCTYNGSEVTTITLNGTTVWVK